MPIIIEDDQTAVKLTAAAGPDEVLTRDGRLLGRFIPASTDPTPLPGPLDPADVLARIRAIAAKFNPATDNPEVTSANVDQVLYGGPGGAR